MVNHPKISRLVPSLKNRNGSIEFFRFLFCLQVLLLHFYHAGFMYKEHDRLPFAGGAIAVEFFFILSGYLFAKSYENHLDNLREESTTLSFFKSKLKRLYPHYLYSFLIYFIIFNFFILDINYKRIGENLLNSIWEILVMPMTGIGDFIYNGATWYISASLIVFLIFHRCMKVNKDIFIKLIFPIMICLIYGYLYQELGWLGPWKTYNFLFRNGLIRAFAGIGLGVLLYYVVEKVKYWKPTNFMRTVFTILEVVAYTISLLFAYLRGNDKFDFFLLLCFVIGIGMSFGNISFTNIIFGNRFVQYLGKLSFPMYLNHWLIMRLMAFRFAENTSLLIVFLYLGIVIMYSVFTLKLVDLIVRLFQNKLCPCLKKQIGY